MFVFRSDRTTRISPWLQNKLLSGAIFVAILISRWIFNDINLHFILFFFARCASDKIGRLIASEGYFYFLLLLLQKCNLYINKKSIYNAADSFENLRSRQMQCLPLNKYLLLMLFFKGNKISQPNKKQPTFSSCFVFQQGIIQTCKHLLCLDFLSKLF